MRRRGKVLLVVLVVVGAAAVTTTVLLEKPGLDDARDRANHTWLTLRAPLSKRYDALERIVPALEAAGAGDRTVTRDLRAALDTWGGLATAGTTRADAGAEVATANRLEGLARRLATNVAASSRMRTDAVTAALAGFTETVVPPPAVRSYNRAARADARARRPTLARWVAAVLVPGERPVLMLGG